MKSKEEIQKMIIYFMLDNDMSVSELADKVKASQASIYRWMENKTTMSNKYYLRFLQLFDGYSPSQWILEMNDNELSKYMFNN